MDRTGGCALNRSPESNSARPMHLAALHVYPVKSLRGCAVPEAEVDALGLAGDRRFMVVDENGRFMTQRTLAPMALIATALTGGELILSTSTAGEVRVPRQPDPDAPLRSVSIWRSEGLLAEDCGDAVADWLSDVLRTPCRLVRAGEKFLRPISKGNVAGEGDRVSFPDAYPFLAISEGSLADLNDRLVAQGDEPVPMNRFRPNLVVADCPPYAEDTWPRFRIGEVAFRAAGPCLRCIVTTTDQETGERSGPEPLRLLATYRRDVTDPSHVKFGQNLIHETKHGVLRVGDPVTLA
jgi:uncharacterized protein